MIWVGGRLVPDDALAVPVLDRTFEHGLGLFETLRTWDGRAPLLARHLGRLADSSETLGIPLDPAALPDAEAVASLVRSLGGGGDALIRITLSGGLSDSSSSTLWMRATPLPPPARGGAVVMFGSWLVTLDDPLARHKTLNYWTRRLAYESARSAGFDEVLSMTLGGSLWEGSRTNLFAIKGDVLVTPSRRGPIVPGILRKLVLELAERAGLGIREVDQWLPPELQAADEVFLTNSVRGIITVARAEARTNAVGMRLHEFLPWTFSWRSPGPWTLRLQSMLADHLASGEEIP